MSLQSYLADLRAALRPALCLHNFPSQRVERHNYPAIEVQTHPELLLPPVTVTRAGQAESCLIEQSVNSTRVSFRFASEEGSIEEYLLKTFLRFMVHRCAAGGGGWRVCGGCIPYGHSVPALRRLCLLLSCLPAHHPPLPPAWLPACPPAWLCRADQLEIVRRVPLPDFSVTFLLTNFHLERYPREGLIHFITSFVEDLHAEVSAMKLGLRSRGRAVVQHYWQQLERRRHGGGGAGGGAEGAEAAAATGGGGGGA